MNWSVEGTEGNYTLYLGKAETEQTYDNRGQTNYDAWPKWPKKQINKVRVRGNLKLVGSAGGMFSGFTNCTDIDLTGIDTSGVTSMKGMFQIAEWSDHNLSSITLGENFDTSNVTDMEAMFNQCAKLTTLSLGAKFDTSNVTKMDSMFSMCMLLEELDLGENFDTSSVTSMTRMFGQCYRLETLDLGEKFDTSSVKKMPAMFVGCNALEHLIIPESFVLGDSLGDYGATEMFVNCNALTSNAKIIIGDEGDCCTWTAETIQTSITGFDENIIANPSTNDAMRAALENLRLLNSLTVGYVTKEQETAILGAKNTLEGFDSTILSDDTNQEIAEALDTIDTFINNATSGTAKASNADELISQLSNTIDKATAETELAAAKDNLETALGNATDLKGKADEYTDSSYEAFETALVNAEAIFEKADATKAEIEEATTELNASINNLVPAVLIAYDSKGGSAVNPATVKVVKNELITAPNPEPTKAGYTFDGWYYEDNGTEYKWNFSSNKPEQNMTLYVKWNAIKYKIAFTYGEGEATWKEFEQDYESVFTAPTDEPEKTGHVFKGWDKEIPTTMPLNGTTINATWEKAKYTVTFNSNGGSPVEPQTVEYEGTATKPADPTPADQDKIFVEWQIDGSAYDFTTTVIGNITLLATYRDMTPEEKAAKELEEAKKAAQATIDDAKSIDMSKYTDESVKALNDAIKAAEDILKDTGATKDQVEEAKKAVEDAVAGLKEKPVQTIPAEITASTPADLAVVEKSILSTSGDNDIVGATYSPLLFRSKKQTKKAIKLKWSGAPGATRYTVYGNLCGNAYNKIATTGGKSLNVTAVAGSALKKGGMYKFVIVAESGDKAVALSKTIFVAAGGKKKVGNNNKVTVKSSVIKKAKKLKNGKTLALKAKAGKKGGIKVKKKAKVRYESTNKAIATVTAGGKVKGVSKGTCYIYAYAQNGIAKKIKVVIK